MKWSNLFALFLLHTAWTAHVAEADDVIRMFAAREKHEAKLNQKQPKKAAPKVKRAKTKLEYHTAWYGPFLAGGGYSSEAMSFATHMVGEIADFRFGAVEFAERLNAEFYEGLPKDMSKKIQKALRVGEAQKKAKVPLVAICHSTPDVWVPSAFAGWDETAPCPPPNAVYKIGRTMYETDSVPFGWVERLNKMDEVWVPTEFHRTSFTKGGVEPSKIVVMPEPVDVEYFNPAKFGVEKLPGEEDGDYKFLSVFKWEERKGWDILLKSYFTAFKYEDPVILFIKTNSFHDEDEMDIYDRIVQFAVKEMGKKEDELPRFEVFDEFVPTDSFPLLYSSVDAFVLPHRGEGWGRPHAEAMAMALPVLATNWSGNTAFMNEKNSYPIKVGSLSPANPNAPKTMKDKDGKDVPNPDVEHQWANADVTHLSETMRHVFENQDEAFKKGYQARKDMVAKYSPTAVGDLVIKELKRIEKGLAIKKKEEMAEKDQKEEL